MSDSSEYSREQEVRDTTAQRPHVVILGAGASLASFPDGDRKGAKLPLMNNLIEVVGLSPILSRYGISAPPGANFEDIYSELYPLDADAKVLREIEAQIEGYFSALQLPDHATIYDKLVLSLREKDLIATFNWDPFLYQACYRNRQVARLPRVAYLHGSVAIGYCMEHRKKGSRLAQCSVCHKPLTPSRLLYPIAEKDYTSDPFISAEWSGLKADMQDAFVLTIFGYGAPSSDAAAIALMKAAWGEVKERELEQTEIVDIKEKNELARSWEPFIHTHHCDIAQSFDESWLGKHPRRTIEAAHQQFLEAKFIDENPTPQGLGLPDLQKWFHELAAFEDSHEAS